jgi:hypothetical protein
MNLIHAGQVSCCVADEDLNSRAVFFGPLPLGLELNTLRFADISIWIHALWNVPILQDPSQDGASAGADLTKDFPKNEVVNTGTLRGSKSAHALKWT